MKILFLINVDLYYNKELLNYSISKLRQQTSHLEKFKIIFFLPHSIL